MEIKRSYMKQEIFEKLILKIKKNTKEIGDCLGEYPATADGIYFADKTKKLELSHIFNWTQSFFTGMAYYAWILSGDKELENWLYDQFEAYYNKVFKTPMDTMHDLGFLYSPYAVAMYKKTGDEKMKEIGIKAADCLAMRYVPNGNYIQAWGRMDGKIPEYVSESLREDVFFKGSKGRAIVDCMMNLPLLFWASEVTQHPFYANIAKSHADMVLKYFVRKDYSVCHAFLFDYETGNLKEEANSCGYANGSHWARGTAWAVYGYAIAYDYTENKKYLEISVKLFEKFIKECNGKMPVWDFRLPESEPQNIDTSAVAVMLCAALEILKHTKNTEIEKFINDFEPMLMEYVDFDLSTNGLLKEQNGRKTYACYGDYYLVEYLCTKYKNTKRIW